MANGGKSSELFLERDAITGSQYKLEKALAPEGEYIWSVRISGSQQWARMNYTQGMVIPTPVVAFGEWSRQKGIPFRIKAPKGGANPVSSATPKQSTDPAAQSVPPPAGQQSRHP